MEEKVELEFCPCKCPPYDQFKKNGEYGKQTGGRPAQHCEDEYYAALLFMQALREGETPRVHCDGVHVKAVVVNGKKFQTVEDLEGE